MPFGAEAVGKESEDGDETLQCGDEAVAENVDEEMPSQIQNIFGRMEGDEVMPSQGLNWHRNQSHPHSIVQKRCYAKLSHGTEMHCSNQANYKTYTHIRVPISGARIVCSVKSE